MLLKNIREKAIEYLKSYNSDSPEADSGLIIMYVLKIDKTALLLGNMDVSVTDEEKIQECLFRLAKGEPVQYVVGECEFMSLPFYVGAGVLIPRLDTEVLVEEILKRLEKIKEPTIADLCCGSGCIGISLGYYLKDSKVKGFDISSLALDTARRNAERNRVSGRVEFFQMDLMNDSILEDFDCVVSNPPYIPSDIINSLDAKVKNFEPLSALDGGKSGLEFYERISAVAPVKKGGIIAFEIGYDQGKEVAEILDKNGYKDIEIIKDLENRDRVVTGISTKVRTADRS